LQVVWRLDRLGRSLGDLIHLTTGLRSRGVDFESLTEKIESGSSAGKLIFHVFASLAEYAEPAVMRSRELDRAQNTAWFLKVSNVMSVRR
jgi:DNA invertase Pin-like site-specific DNA recombinase